MNLKLHTLLLMVLIFSLSACKDRRSDKAEIEVTPGPLADPSAYAARVARRESPQPPMTEPPITDPNVNKPLPLSQKKGVVKDEKKEGKQAHNPLFENPILTQTFQIYTEEAGIDDPKMEGMLDKLKDEDLSSQDLTAMMNQYFSIIENTDSKLAEKLTMNIRMRSVFELFATNEQIANTIKQKVDAATLDGFSPEELKVVTPIAYASQVYGKLKNTTVPLPIVYSSTNSADNKKYRTVILGRIDFSKGVKKKSLEKSELMEIESLRAILNGLLSSSSKPASLAMKIVGFADRDKPANAEKNLTNGLKRAQILYDAFAQEESLKAFTVESMGDQYPAAQDASLASNRRAEIFLFHRVVEVQQMGVPTHAHEDETDTH